MKAPIAILPRLQRFALKSFVPIFTQDAELELQKGVNIVLGGNGVGKTTLMQAIVYGMAGGTAEIEEEKSNRWDYRYFQERLSPDRVGSAQIEVAFAFGSETLTVRRGFLSNDVLAFRLNSDPWIEGTLASDSYASALADLGGYNSPADFKFLVHTLLYLPESRRLIAWDVNAQTRLQMLLHRDIAPRIDFEAARMRLKRLDSARRHTHVDLVKVEQRIKERRTRKASTPGQKTPKSEDVGQFQQCIDDLQRIGRDRLAVEKESSRISVELSQISEQIETLREQVDAVEASLVLDVLARQEKENSLALQKLVELGLCPACGTRQEQLQAVAKKHARTHSCTLCGSEIAQNTDIDLATRRSRLLEKIHAKTALEQEWRNAEAHVQHLKELENEAQRRVNEIRFSQPRVSLQEALVPSESASRLASLRMQLARQEAEIASQIEDLSRSLEREYDRFQRSVIQRAAKLRRTYEQYATAFLGIPCELIQVESMDRLLNLLLFVPRFEEIDRPTPNACSEAQRFFLDIAFRMALIDNSTDLSEAAGSFLCETPETALDLTYVENVVSMLSRFADKGHNCLYSVNVQVGGIGEQLLQTIPSARRRSRVLNLLTIGKLSNVQRAKQSKINRAVRKMLN